MNTLDRILAKIEAIREDQVRAIEMLREVQHLVRTPTPSVLPTAMNTSLAPTAQPTEVETTTKVLRWLMSTKPLMWLLQAFWKHLPTLGAIIYMKATGQDEKVMAYLNGLLGI